MRNIFLQKSYTKFGVDPNPRPFSKNAKLSTSLDQQPKFSNSLFLLYDQFEEYQHIETKMLSTYFYIT